MARAFGRYFWDRSDTDVERFERRDGIHASRVLRVRALRQVRFSHCRCFFSAMSNNTAIMITEPITIC